MIYPMKSYLLLVLCCLFSGSILAQDVQVDRKTGLVQVDGQDAFYLVAKETGKKYSRFFEKDYSLQNLDHQELAYLTLVKTESNGGNGSVHSVPNFDIAFTKSGNRCMLNRLGMSIVRQLAMIIAAANLVQNGQISDEAEQQFLAKYKGNKAVPGNPFKEDPRK